MQVEAGSTLATMARSAGEGATLKSVANVAVLRKVLDVAGAQALELVQSLQPHLGQRIDAHI